mmetsp:Transcript_34093/g.74829  ORF Transcript_34093/g.74829 Transcript_34093/m.74829 type:complete len:221 (-) Transcript_34093:24-686(-)
MTNLGQVRSVRKIQSRELLLGVRVDQPDVGCAQSREGERRRVHVDCEGQRLDVCRQLRQPYVDPLLVDKCAKAMLALQHIARVHDRRPRLAAAPHAVAEPTKPDGARLIAHSSGVVCAARAVHINPLTVLMLPAKTKIDTLETMGCERQRHSNTKRYWIWASHFRILACLRGTLNASMHSDILRSTIITRQRLRAHHFLLAPPHPRPRRTKDGVPRSRSP